MRYIILDFEIDVNGSVGHYSITVARNHTAHCYPCGFNRLMDMYRRLGKSQKVVSRFYPNGTITQAYHYSR